MDVNEAPEKLPDTFKEFCRRFPELGRLHQETGKALQAVGPLDAKTCELIKVGMCVGAGLESALRSHAHRAMKAGATEAEVEHAILLGMTTCGFPATARAWSWALVQFDRERAEQGQRSEIRDQKSEVSSGRDSSPPADL